MRLLTLAVFLVVSMISVSAHAEIEVVRAGGIVAGSEEALVDDYSRDIKRLDKESEQLSAQILIRRHGLSNDAESADGMKVVLIQARR